jgi:hypothetical protein
LKKKVKKKEKKKKKKKSACTWQPVTPFPIPFIAVVPFTAVWDGLGACEN